MFQSVVVDGVVFGFSLGMGVWLITFGVYKAWRGFWDFAGDYS